MLNEILHSVVPTIVSAIELVGVAIIAIGTLVTLLQFALAIARRVEIEDAVGTLRSNLGRAILVGLELLVVADPHPTTWASLAVHAGRKDGAYLLPVATQFECSGSRIATNRAMQWGEQIVKPIFESKDDYEIIYRLSEKLGFADRMFKNIKVENKQPSPEDLLREINRGGFSTGDSG